MRGHVHRRGSSWSVVYDEGTRDDGKRRQRTKGGFPTKKAAEAFLTDQLARLGDGSYSAPSKQTIGSFLTDEWLPSVEATVRPLSFARYAQSVKTCINPRIGQLRLQGLSAGRLTALHRELEQEGYSASTVRSAHTVLHRALRDAMRWGKLTRNPAELADPPRAGSLAGAGMDRDRATRLSRPHG